MKYVVQEILPDCKQHCLILLHIKNNGNVLRQLQKKKILQTKYQVSKELNKID